ncbi:TPA: PAS domain-containing protein [Methanosarcina acetivorans]|nr:MASE3 domain-containing protein [Methanosarcina acetivorans]HIH95620.1 PAS domain-containing protein [Methanosarcina acetivorans]
MPLKSSLIKLGLFLIIAGLLYIISLKNYLLFRIVVNQFNVIIAYMVFIIVWKSKVISENRYLTFVGTALFFIACLGFLRAFSYERIGVFSGYGANLPAQLWISIRYMGGVSFFVAPLLLTRNVWDGKSNLKPSGNDLFARKVFLVYAIITAALLLSIFHYGNFPDCYVENYGLTHFKIYSEYFISFLFICSLMLLYQKRNSFEKHVFRILMASIALSILTELALTYYTYTEEFFNFIGHIFNVLSVYLIYIAIVETGFEEPCSLFFRDLKFREEAFRREATFLKDDQGRIYRMLGLEKCTPAGEPAYEDLQTKAEHYSSLLQNVQGIIGFRLDEKGVPIFMEGAVEAITGYGKKDFISGKMKWTEIVVPEDRPLILDSMKKAELSPESSHELEYRVRRKDGEIRWVREIMQPLPEDSGMPGQFQGFIRDITQRKMAEETLSRTEEARIKEIHHRIKNNLQVISSMLSLQAEKFSDEETLEAFRESQNRVTSMALIHEELYEGKDMETLDFAVYLRRLIGDLLSSYTVGNREIDLKLDLKQIYLGMDTAVPLGIVVNELVSNSLKHAFPAGKRGEIRISLSRSENYEKRHENGNFEVERYIETGSRSIEPDEMGIEKSEEGIVRCSGSKRGIEKSEKDPVFMLIVADNGNGFPQNIDFRNTDSLGLQLVSILVEQINGSIELNRDEGTEFRILFGKVGN